MDSATMTFSEHSPVEKDSSSHDNGILSNEVPSSTPKFKHGDENQENLTTDFSKILALSASREELLNNVQKLKKDMQDWRMKLDSQLTKYRQELGELRNTLNTEVVHLKNEFQDLRESLKKPMDVPSDLAEDAEDVSASTKKMEAEH